MFAMDLGLYSGANPQHAPPSSLHQLPPTPQPLPNITSSSTTPSSSSSSSPLATPSSPSRLQQGGLGGSNTHFGIRIHGPMLPSPPTPSLAPVSIAAPPQPSPSPLLSHQRTLSSHNNAHVVMGASTVPVSAPYGPILPLSEQSLPSATAATISTGGVGSYRLELRIWQPQITNTSILEIDSLQTRLLKSESWIELTIAPSPLCPPNLIFDAISVINGRHNNSSGSGSSGGSNDVTSNGWNIPSNAPFTFVFPPVRRAPLSSLLSLDHIIIRVAMRRSQGIGLAQMRARDYAVMMDDASHIPATRTAASMMTSIIPPTAILPLSLYRHPLSIDAFTEHYNRCHPPQPSTSSGGAGVMLFGAGPDIVGQMFVTLSKVDGNAAIMLPVTTAEEVPLRSKPARQRAGEASSSSSGVAAAAPGGANNGGIRPRGDALSSTPSIPSSPLSHLDTTPSPRTAASGVANAFSSSSGAPPPVPHVSQPRLSPDFGISHAPLQYHHLLYLLNADNNPHTPCDSEIAANRRKETSSCINTICRWWSRIITSCCI
jgi:hypothetical protein